MQLPTANRPSEGRSDDSFDVIVVGGGPGGAATAYHLATGGARVLLVEKATYPRDKVCGDGLTPRAVAAIDAMGLRDARRDWPRNVGLRLHGAGHHIELLWPEVTGTPSYGLTCPRVDLDHLLARRAVEAGATLWQSTDVVRPIVEHGLVVGAELARDGEDPFDVRSELLIAADGASSRIGQALGHARDSRRPIGVAIRQYFRTELDEEPWLDAYLELTAGEDLLPGYGWVFPMGDGTVNVGGGLLNTSSHFQRTNYKEMLKRWAPTAGRTWGFTLDDAIGKPRSHPLPMGGNRHPALARGVMFVGDAAGMVNPFNGEGITYAIETGEMAARTALRVLAGGDRSILRSYPRAVVRRYGSYYSLGRGFVKLIGNPRLMAFGTRHGMRHPALMQLAIKILGDMYEPRGGDLSDRVVRAMLAMTPAR
ncbi:MAG TPA: geranylgeranyl reductase family protein [Actinomycetes bacterium]|nr:geranylgeranyl reductase family protein [Actinomycetes bacterium]